MCVPATLYDFSHRRLCAWSLSLCWGGSYFRPMPFIRFRFAVYFPHSKFQLYHFGNVWDMFHLRNYIICMQVTKIISARNTKRVKKQDNYMCSFQPLEYDRTEITQRNENKKWRNNREYWQHQNKTTNTNKTAIPFSIGYNYLTLFTKYKLWDRLSAYFL